MGSKALLEFLLCVSRYQASNQVVRGGLVCLSTVPTVLEDW